ncbi:MAG: hypothetical protein ACYCQK_01755 [Acidiferrobacteraceae bacterium]
MASYDADKHCGGQRANQPPGVLCTRPKGWGTSHPGIGRCKRHGGATETHERAAQREIAQRAVIRFGLRRDVSPHEALLEMVQTSAGLVAEYEAVIAQIDRERLVNGIVKTVQLPDGGRRVEAMAARAVWLDLYNEERDRLVRACREAIHCGVAERQVRLAEQMAQQLAAVVTAILTDLGHDLSDQRTREIVRLRMIEGGRGVLA